LAKGVVANFFRKAHEDILSLKQSLLKPKPQSLWPFLSSKAKTSIFAILPLTPSNGCVAAMGLPDRKPISIPDRRDSPNTSLKVEKIKVGFAGE